MITVLKLASLSAILSAGVVTAYEAPRAPVSGSAKLYYDRVVPEAPASIVLADATASVTRAAVVSDASADCGAQAWPYVAKDCIAGLEGSVRKVVRTITIERRDAPNTSTLVRLPAGPAPVR